MTELTDLSINIQIAKIEGAKDIIRGQIKPNEIAVVLENTTKFNYNPIQDDALCFQLMVKYQVDTVHERFIKQALIYDDPEDNPIGRAADKSMNKAILLAIIEANKEQPSNINEMTMELLVKEKEALKCQINMLRGFISAQSSDFIDTIDRCGKVIEPKVEAHKVLCKTSKQCLNSIKADAIEEAAHKTRESMQDGCPKWLCRVSDLEAYANKLRGGNG